MTPDATEDERLRIDYVPLSDLLRRRHPRNPKEHALEELDDSMSRFGYTMPVALDEATGNLAAGHGRVDTLEARRQEGKEPPERVEAEDGDWLVPTIRGLSFDDPDELLSYLMADNLLTERGGWNEAFLSEVVMDLRDAMGEEGFVGTGLDDEDVASLLGEWDPDEQEPDEFGEDAADDLLAECPECGHEFVPEEG